MGSSSQEINCEVSAGVVRAICLSLGGHAAREVRRITLESLLDIYSRLLAVGGEAGGRGCSIVAQDLILLESPMNVHELLAIGGGVRG